MIKWLRLVGIEMEYKKALESLADKYHLQMIYAFGSRAKEVLHIVEEKSSQSAPSKSDLDIGIKSEKRLNVEKKWRSQYFSMRLRYYSTSCWIG